MCVCVSVYMITYTLYVHSLICSIYYCIISAIIDVINIVITIVSIIVIIVFFRADREFLEWKTRALDHLISSTPSPHSLHPGLYLPYLAVFGGH